MNGRGIKMSHLAIEAPTSQDAIDAQEFPAFLAHEVRGPLTVILGNALLLLRRETLDQETRKSIEDIRDEAEKLRRIIEGLLALLGDHLESEPISTRTVVGGVVDRFRREHPARSLNLWLRTDSLTMGVQSYVEEILENLLSNADKYSPLGESINVEVGRSGPNLTISVENRGREIDLTDQKRIFDLFVRLDSAAVIPGHGIGLALSRRLAEEMHGQLTYKECGPGCCRFSLTLPVLQRLDGLPVAGPEAHRWLTND